MDPTHVAPILHNLNALAGGLFLLTALGVVATRQILASVRWFILQSVLLAGAACVQAIPGRSGALFGLAALALVTRALLLPWLLGRTIQREVLTRREIARTLAVPTSLLIAVSLALVSYLVARPLVVIADGSFAATSLPIGLSGLLIGAYVVSVRREAIGQLLGLLTAENGVFFAGIAIAGDLPIIVEIAVALDILMIAVVLGLLTRRIEERTGHTNVGELDALGEE